MAEALALTNANTAGDWHPTHYWQQPYVPYIPSPTVITYVWPQQQQRCAWCQGTHWDKCPNLKAVVYRSDGTVERVEFFEVTDG